MAACSTVISLNGKVMSQVIKGHKTQCRSFAEQKARHEAAEKAVATEVVATDDVAAAAAARDAPAEAATDACEDPQARRLIDARILPFMTGMIEDGLVGEALLDLDARARRRRRTGWRPSRRRQRRSGGGVRSRRFTVP